MTRVFPFFQAALAAVLVLAAPVRADSPVERLEQLMTQSAVPRWQQSAREIEAVRKAPPAPALAKAWDEMDQAVAGGKEMQALARAASPRSAAERDAYAVWLRWRILARNADGRYSYNYAFNLNSMRAADGGFGREAAVFLYHARLALEIDGARCAEGSGADRVSEAFEQQPNFQPVLEGVKALSDRERATAWLEAVAIERARGQRPASPWLCRAGSLAMANAMRRGAQFHAAPEAGAPEYIGGKGNLHVIDTTLDDMELVPEPAWLQRRQEILARRTGEAAAQL